MRRNIKNAFLTVGIVVLLTLLFIFSSQSSDKSYEVTDKVLDTVVERPVTQADWDWRAKVIPAMRKAAHIVFFLLLAILFTLLFWEHNRVWLWALLSSGFVGAIDEIHQFFVPGRGASVTDVLIDLAGALFGVIIVYVVLSLRKRNESISDKDVKD